ncbi:MAG: IS200/IS605 family accessory protein TnpB-related protein, partial [Desulfovibrionaceae bacterium]|nr:IS200/IS605 family accessory protein TnpB-related protein [Desulfovibrionaceae bacterium]
RKEQKLLSLNHSLTNIINNYLHQITSTIIKREPSFICVEDLNVKGMLSNPKLANQIQKAKFYKFRRQLEYKSYFH